MKESDIFSPLKTRKCVWQWLFRYALLVFFSTIFLMVKAQCPKATATPSATTVCSGTASSIVLTSDQSGTVFSWNVEQSGVAGAIDGTGSGITNILSATEAGSGSVVYTITPLANGCKGTPEIITITVNPIPLVIAVPLTSTIISGATSSITLSSDIAETTFLWTVSRSGVTGAAPGTGQVISQKISASAEKGMATYRITPNFKGCPGNSINVKVIVKNKL